MYFIKQLHQGYIACDIVYIQAAQTFNACTGTIVFFYMRFDTVYKYSHFTHKLSKAISPIFEIFQRDGAHDSFPFYQHF